MNHQLDQLAPYVRYVRFNVSPVAARSFIDPEYVFTYMKSGRGIYVVEGVEYPVQAGDMILMAPYMLHITQSEPGEEMVQCVIHFDLFYRPERAGMISCDPEMTHRRFVDDHDNCETLLTHAPLRQSAVPDAIQARVYRQYEILSQSFRDRDGKLRLWHERAAMLEILALYLEHQGGETATTERNRNWQNIERALAYIHAHYAKPVRLKEVSREAGISMNYFCLLFKQYTGQSMHQYVNELRIYQAKRLIENSELTLTEIADAVGINDIHSFSKLFRKYEKITPSAYRRRAADPGR